MRIEPALYGGRPAATCWRSWPRVPDERPRARRRRARADDVAARALLLAGPGSDPGALARIREKYPTNGVAVLRFEIPWAQVPPGAGVLETFAVPRA